MTLLPYRCQVVIPILALRDKTPGGIPLFGKSIFQPFAGLVPRGIVIQTEQDLLELRVLRQHPQHRLTANAAERHIAVLLPVVGVQRDIGEHIDGRFKHIKAIACPDVMEAVGRAAAFHIALESSALRVEPPLVGMSGNAVFIASHKYGISSSRSMEKRSAKL